MPIARLRMAKPSKWINIEDNTCKWYEFENEEPIAVMRCNWCGNQPGRR